MAPTMTTEFYILLVDDHEDSASVLARLLRRERENYTVFISRNCKGALELATKRRFDLLVSDIGLPDGDGCELLQQIRAIYPIPAIALTAYAYPQDLQRYQNAGFDDQIIKPASLNSVLGSIDRIIAATPVTADIRKASFADFS
jgi:CheY-like chemotaxis protein